ncbi:MAG: F0F1 ATP synthase subunit epsilon [Planctomycetaceae bacterium]
MIAATELRLVLVTPETTLLDERVRSLQFPLYDGQMGVLPGRAPLVGRLGIGELRIETSAGNTERYFLDGGFVQIKGSVVTLLTNRSLRVESINLGQAEADLAAALAQTPTTAAALDAKQQSLQRARRMIALRK